MKCIAVFGPTASGKSSLALSLARKIGGAVISADSMQIYQKMDIGTAKPSREEMELVPHEMIDVVSPDTPFSVYDYKRMAEERIRSVHEKGFVPIVVGGTGMYFDALFYGTDFGEFKIDPAVRASLTARAENGENRELLELLQKIDPEAAAKLHLRDTKRILRALEVYYSTGKTISAFRAESKNPDTDFEFCKFHLTFSDRSLLYARINLRVDQMIREGLVRETAALVKEGILSSPTASQAICYKEMLPFLQHEKSLEECAETLKLRTRQYAKRQITWFKRYTDAVPIEMDRDPDPVKTVLETVNRFLEG
ncbi:MAG: tRNA (adenosine(37)-N6)-dimethylallyltransferase MiaA [Clostridia bacterium]|nr:tRNA (adenosine(37)-N6)-dimethylallyltransferase MiaA [Clostridia bacterium]